MKTTVLSAVIASALTLSAQSVVAADLDKMSQVTIIPNHNASLIRNFNPYAVSRLHTARDFIFEPLVVFNELKGNVPEFRLATNYQLSKDLLSITFDLREGVKWSDGETFDADDVVFTFNLVKAHSSIDDRGINSKIKSVEKLGPYQVRFHLTEVNTNISYEIVQVPVVPEHQWNSVEDPAVFMNPNPVGTGPFTELPQFTSTLFVQCRNPHYWDDANLDVDCLRVPQMNHNDQVLGELINSRIDWAGSFVPDIDETFLKASPDHGYWFPPAGTQAFVFNYQSKDKVKHEVLTDIEFRRAFSMALDRQTLIDIANYGNAVLNDFASGLGYAFETWSDEAVHNKYKPFMTYSPEKAKALLAQAGYKDINGDGFVESPSGAEFELSIQSPQGWTDFNNTVMLATEQLNEVGIKVKARTPDFSIYNKGMISADYDIAYTNYFHGPTPHKYWDSGYHSRLQASEGMPRFAMHHWQNAELDTLLDSFYKTADSQEQRKIAHSIQKLIAENQVTVPVLSGPNFYQYNTKRFTGWWTKDNPKGRPMIWEGTPERLLHVLDLKPRS
ncbi:ABC transporter substrate-binding protein [Vibrio sp. 404]|uniref:ABC transporter substrate-binding protein n=1 Tax=Vibrio marinisediminis TaxID=2758441 RepID=A0A7W2IV16_9VIBR|nr:ABC transporter substrate-binding protein [Vibrio marinisediminis]MBA5764151.1 ABC transporter substrate-binding protein [Vibrio marinisediminis]